MNTRLLRISVLALLTASLPAAGQVCSPDTVQYTSPGIYPDSATGIPPAIEGVAYSIVITAIVPPDTFVDIGGGPVYATIDSIVLVKILNKPAWLTYDCEPASCGFPGGGSGCALFHGTPPPGSAGKDTLDIVIRQYGKISGFPVSLPDTLFSLYVAEVLAGTGVGNVEEKGLYFGNIPMPYTSGDVIEIISPKAERVSLSMIGLDGRALFAWDLRLQTGNTLTMAPLTEVKPGAYVLSLISGEGRISRILIVQ